MKAVQKKILIDLTPVLPGGANGGAKVFVLDLVKQLVRLRPDIDWVLCINPSVKEELSILKSSNVNFLILENTNHRHKKSLAIRFFIKIIKKNTIIFKFSLIAFQAYRRFLQQALIPQEVKDVGIFDLLFCPFTSPIYFRSGVPAVSIIYDLQYKTYPHFFTDEDNYHRDRTFRTACQRATKLVAISEYSRLKALEHCQELEPDNIKTIHLAMANRLANNTFNEKYLNEKNLKVNQYIIYPANFWKHKNHEMLITAFQIARHQGLDKEIKLVFTGAPSERQTYLKTITEKFNLSAEVVFLDYVSTDDLASLMHYSLAMIFPSLYEGFGIPLVEAMALGVPIACSNLTSLPEVGADAVLLFDPKNPQEIADSIFNITSDEALRQKLISQGKIRARAFSDTEKMALDYISIFEDAMMSFVNKDTVSGIHVDGWAEGIICLNIEKNVANQHIELVFFAPKSVGKMKKIEIKKICTQQQKEEKKYIKLNSGEQELVKIPITDAGGRFNIRISPIFSPSLIDSNSKDNRNLSLQVKTCKIVRKDGIEKDLLQEIL